ncbi:MAG: hypothetical protein GJ671_08440 [Alteromonadaceae bacterium]|nr:hypothetical protein [Alteromonadaceae bacterium]
MRQFFWIIIAIYALLYFYAVYLYDEFNLGIAFGIFAAIIAQFYYARKKLAQHEADVASGKLVTKEAKVKPLSFWSSPFPYVGIAFLTYLGVIIIL